MSIALRNEREKYLVLALFAVAGLTIYCVHDFLGFIDGNRADDEAFPGDGSYELRQNDNRVIDNECGPSCRCVQW